MVIPVYDENYDDQGQRPWVMWTLFAINVLVVGFLWLLPVQSQQELAFHFGVVAAFVTGSFPVGDLELLVPPAVTLVTYMFMHGNWLHLAGNVIFLWVFGDNIEAAMGHLRFLAFYLLCGIAGGLAHIASEPSSLVPLIGASGAIAGIVSAYLMLHPWAYVTVLLFGIMTARIHAYWLLGAWIAWQVASALFVTGTEIAYWNHVGGLLAGAGLVVVLRRPGVKLFQRQGLARW